MLTPIATARWDYGTAAHLLNRAGFGGPPTEVEALQNAGPEAAVDRMLRGGASRPPVPLPPPAWAKPDADRIEKWKRLRTATEEERRAFRQSEQKAERERVQDLRRWWLERMVTSPHPLEERLVLFWHGHFATSVQKVKSAWLMFRQMETFRAHAVGNWRDLLMAVTRDPAMLVWLDQAQSRREHPNENYAREVMELFALGEGHYEERDIRDAARALTGLTYDRVRQEAAWRPRAHDDGIKQVLGKTGRLKPEDVIGQIVSQPQASRFIVAKLWSFFAHEAPSKPLVDALAVEFERGGRRFEPLLRAMFRSEAFYSHDVVRSQIKSPVQWLVMALRQMERPLPGIERVAPALRQLGQDLLAPPNVKGWDGGQAWINTSTLTLRQEYAALLVQGAEGLAARMAPARAEALRRRARGRAGDADRVVAEVRRWLGDPEPASRSAVMKALERRFLQAAFRPRLAEDVREALGDDAVPDARAVIRAVSVVMQSTDYQLT